MPEDTDSVYYDNTGGPSPSERVRTNAAITECFLPWPAGGLSPMHFGEGDPRQVLLDHLPAANRDGWIMVQRREVEAVCTMRVCRSTAVFDSDEDGSRPARMFYCMLEAGHTRGHTNGYHTWPAKPIPAEGFEVGLLEWVNKQIAGIQQSSTSSTSVGALSAFEAMRRKLVG